MTRRLVYIGLGLIALGFLLSLWGSYLNGPEGEAVKQDDAIAALAHYLGVALKQMFLAIDQSLNGDTTGDKLQGIGAVSMYLGVVFLFVALIKYLVSGDRRA